MTRVVLVTGASGFIGKRLVVSLAQEGWQVRAAARDPENVPDASGIERVAMPDLARPADWSALLEGASHVVHLAGIAHAPGTLPDALYSRVNADPPASLQTRRAARSSGSCSCRRCGRRPGSRPIM